MSLKFQMPNRRVAYFAITILATIIVVIYLNQNPQLFQKKDVLEKTVVSLEIENEKISSQDSDGDGLYDWEEYLRKTDPHNPDTDGDGTSDGDEIALGRDPLVPGPDDKVTNGINTSGIELGIETDPDSFSSQASQNILMSILESNNNPNTIFDPKQIVDEIEKEAADRVKYSPKYSKKNIITVSNSEDNIKKYYNELIPILVVNFIDLLSQDIESPLDMKDKIPPIYDKISESLFLIQAPDDLSDIHLEFVNIFDEVSFYSKIILNEKGDPLLSYYALPDYMDANKNLEQLYTQIINYPEKNGIIFEEGEPAYDFFNEETE